MGRQAAMLDGKPHRRHRLVVIAACYEVQMSITDLPIWSKLVAYLQVERYDRDGGHANPRIRIEFRDVPAPLMKDAMFTQTACCTCGRPVNPFRRREGDHDRLYLAPACPIGIRIACSRGAAAAAVYEEIGERWKVIEQNPTQLPLF